MDIYTTLLIMILFVELIGVGRLVCSSGMWILIYFVVNVITPIISDMIYQPATTSIHIGITGFAFGMNVCLLMPKFRYKKSGNFLYHKPDLLKYAEIRRFLFIILIAALVMYYGLSGLLALFFGNNTMTTIINAGGIPFWGHLVTVLIEIFTYFNALILIFDSKENMKANAIWLIFSYGLQALCSYARAPVIYTAGIIIVYYMRKKKPQRQALIAIPTLVIGIFAMVILIFFRNYGIGNTILNLGKYITQKSVWMNISDYLDFPAGYTYFVDLLKNGENIRVNYMAIFKPLFILIPRSLWAGKPNYLTVEILSQLHPELYKAGFSTGFGLLGEAHALMGNIGCFIIPFVTGVVCTILDNKFIYLVRNGIDNNLWTWFYLMFTVVILITNARGGLVDSYTSWMFPTIFSLFIGILPRIAWRKQHVRIRLRKT